MTRYLLLFLAAACAAYCIVACGDPSPLECVMEPAANRFYCADGSTYPITLDGTPLACPNSCPLPESKQCRDRNGRGHDDHGKGHDKDRHDD